MKTEGNKPLALKLVAGMIILSASIFVACGGEAGPEPSAQADTIDDEAAEQYREKVERRVSASVVSSFSREWSVPESKVECVLAELSVTDLYGGADDPAVVAVFDKCGVDPGVLE